jgi:hypothetical protein
MSNRLRIGIASKKPLNLRAKKKIEEKTACIVEMIKPRWMTNCASLADRLYELRPCHRRSFVKWLNWLMEKSAAKEACLPSFPTIPTPAKEWQLRIHFFAGLPFEQTDTYRHLRLESY